MTQIDLYLVGPVLWVLWHSFARLRALDLRVHRPSYIAIHFCLAFGAVAAMIWPEIGVVSLLIGVGLSLHVTRGQWTAGVPEKANKDVLPKS